MGAGRESGACRSFLCYGRSFLTEEEKAAGEPESGENKASRGPTWQWLVLLAADRGCRELLGRARLPSCCRFLGRVPFLF